MYAHAIIDHSSHLSTDVLTSSSGLEDGSDAQLTAREKRGRSPQGVNSSDAPRPSQKYKLQQSSSQPAIAAAVSLSKSAADLRDRIQVMLLEDARALMRELGGTACPLCTAHACREQSRRLEGVRHKTLISSYPVIDNASSLRACQKMKKHCLRCFGSDHISTKCNAFPSPEPWVQHKACKACTLQVQGEPQTHSDGHTNPQKCDGVGRNFTREFGLALYLAGDLHLLFRTPRHQDLVFRGEKSPSSQQLRGFMGFIYEPIFQGSVLSKGLVLLLYGCRQRSQTGARPTTKFTPDMLRHILQHGFGNGCSDVFKGLQF